MDPINKGAPSKKADYYGTFLDSVRQESPDQQVQQNDPDVAVPAEEAGADVAGEEAPAEPVAAEEEMVDPIALLKVLRETGTQSMTTLQATTNLRFSKFAEIVGKLEEAGLVLISGQPGSEQVELLPAGATLADLG